VTGGYLFPPRLGRRLASALLLLGLAAGCFSAARQPLPGAAGAAANRTRQEPSPPAPAAGLPATMAVAGAEVDGPLHFPVVLNARVADLLRALQDRSETVSRSFARVARYGAMMRRILREKGLPEELTNLVVVESEADPHATSPVNAAGIWQFMPSTARRYGLRTTAWLDERRDPEKSTRGAAEHLTRLYARFRSWPLALAAYNAGEAAVHRAIQRQRTRDFWQLDLPSETERFVPAVMAMTLIARDPARYGVARPDDLPDGTELLHLDHPVEIGLLAHAAGTSVRQLRDLNPELVGSSTPPNQPRYRLRIPRGAARAVLDSLRRIPPEQRIGWIPHVTRRGDTPRMVATRYGVSLHALRAMNDLAHGEALRPGGVLFVPAVSEPDPPAVLAGPAAPSPVH
jgi:membrane-bound lytic murein transglycosylase D